MRITAKDVARQLTDCGGQYADLVNNFKAETNGTIRLGDRIRHAVDTELVALQLKEPKKTGGKKPREEPYAENDAANQL